MLRVQISLMLHKKGFIFSLSFMYILCIAYYLFVCILTSLQTDSSYICAAQNVFILCSLNNGANILTMIFPIIVLLPFSFSLINDETTNAAILYQSRASYFKYYLAKASAAFIGSFIIMFLPCLLNLIQVYLTFPISGRILDGFNISSSSYSHSLFNLYNSSLNFHNNPFESIIITNPFLYDVIYLLCFSLYSGIIGLFGLSLSTLFKPKYKILLFLPYIIISLVLIRTVAAYRQIFIADPILYVLPNTIGFNWLFFFLYISFILLISVYLLIKAVIQKSTEGR